jgi:hypothetical protein
MRLIALILCMLAFQLQAASLLVNQNGAAYNGYGPGGLAEFSSYLDNEFSTVSAGDLSNLNTMLTYDAIWVTVGNYGDGQELTSGEVANLSAYAAAGGKVLLHGEHAAWDSWNQSILDVVGGGSSTSVLDNTDGSSFSITEHELLTGVDEIVAKTGGQIIDDGSVNLLFDSGVAGVWGDNVLAIMDVSMWTNVYTAEFLPLADNDQFAQNTAQWLASSSTVVPIPAAVWLFGSGLGLLGWVRRKATV